MAKEGGRGGRSEQPGSIMPRLLKRLGLTRSFQTHQLFYDWERVVGAGIAMHVRPVRLDFHTLFLQADSPVWANQLMLIQEELLQRINGYGASRLVKEIRFSRLPYWQKAHPVREAARPAEPQEYRLPPATAEERQRASAACSSIGDEDLRAAAGRAMERMLARRRAQQEQGWTPCPACGSLCPAGQKYCSGCSLRHKQQLSRKVRRYLEIKPWATYSEIFEQFECGPELLREVRLTLLQTWLGRLTYSEEDRHSQLAKRLVMLYTAREPEQVSPELQEKILKKLRFDLRPLPREKADTDKEKRA